MYRSDTPTTLRTLAATPEAVTVEAAQTLLVIADRVEAMEAQNARLREALQAIVRFSDESGSAPVLLQPYGKFLSAARAALAGKEG